MALPFINRTHEWAELDRLSKKTGLVVIFGRRRVGKTRLLTQWLKSSGGLYTQAIESDSETQIVQTFEDLKSSLNTEIRPKNWTEFFELLQKSPHRVGASDARSKAPHILCLDEFPYLVASDPSLPSIFQKWLDHGNRSTLLILSGSSTHMMNDLFLNRAAPLYGRALKILKIEPMGYHEFCHALKIEPKDQASFTIFSLVGGIPRYWELLEQGDSPSVAAQRLYFDLSPDMEGEPQRLFIDEKIAGLNPLNLLEIIGRGSEKPSEMASRLGTAQTNLSRLLQQLMDSSIIMRHVPYGQSHRNAKKVLYKIVDPTLRFWFSTFSPHRVRWQTYQKAEKDQLLTLHASTVFEDYCRILHQGSSRYWDKTCEFDLVRPDESGKGLIISEVKYKRLTSTQKKQILKELAFKWNRCELKSLHMSSNTPKFEVLDLDTLQE